MKKKHPLSDLHADVRDHLELETQENIERGMAPEDARYAALRKFGNVSRAHENTRAVWIPVWLDQFRQDIRHAGWTLRRSPGFAAVAIVTIALAIGPTAAIFSLLNALVATTFCRSQ
jgi:putative ABC transport system permease protein